MIISHKHKFIFLKTNKTAGTSIEIALSEFCGEKDIITPISPKDEQIRKGLDIRGPQNYKIPLSQYFTGNWIRFIKKRKRRLFYNHICASKVKGLIGEEVWNGYYKFCFERNPWDRVISLYYHQTKEPRPSISEFIESKRLSVLKKRGFQVYTIDGKLAIDRVYLYEDLNKEIKKISKRFGFPHQLNLPQAKANYRTDKRHYREILSHEESLKISSMFAQEIELFKYEY
ncbi:MAG: sulfotransferase family 2 domain-containing protein [Thermodesulfobacteriota bacterium]|nr:sulfotransferase family 2 domain-containing protein [Thermodesulfobacteriota bacterium]